MDYDKMKIKLCLIGDRAVGKTCLVERYMMDHFSGEYRQTMGAKVYKKVVKLQLELREKMIEIDMTLWDIMGDLPLSDLTDEAYFRGVQGLLAVCDVTRRSTAESLDHWIAATPESVRNLPMCIIVNKDDLVDQVEVHEDDVFRLGDVFSSSVVMTSAKTGNNVQQAFEFLAKSIVERQLGPDTDFLAEERFGIRERPAGISAKAF
ncbi:MAG: GTP-binding protein [Candidatus Thermoplasmatota archaeon]|nr:GTP-binding protein [Candidatus Thermoplasmatota archaeon]